MDATKSSRAVTEDLKNIMNELKQMRMENIESNSIMVAGWNTRLELLYEMIAKIHSSFALRYVLEPLDGGSKQGGTGD